MGSSVFRIVVELGLNLYSGRVLLLGFLMFLIILSGSSCMILGVWVSMFMKWL